MDEEVTVEELTLEDKLAWRKKVSSVDASLKSVLESSAAEHRGHFPALSRNKKATEAEEPKTKPAGRASKGMRFGIHHAPST
jgi:hypothetical protein